MNDNVYTVPDPEEQASSGVYTVPSPTGETAVPYKTATQLFNASAQGIAENDGDALSAIVQNYSTSEATGSVGGVGYGELPPHLRTRSKVRDGVRSANIVEHGAMASVEDRARMTGALTDLQSLSGHADFDTMANIAVSNPTLLLTDNPTETIVRATANQRVYERMAEIWEENDWIDVTAKIGAMFITPEARTPAYMDLAETAGIEWQADWVGDPSELFLKIQDKFGHDPEAMAQLAHDASVAMSDGYLTNDIMTLDYISRLADSPSTSGHVFDSVLEKGDWVLTALGGVLSAVTATKRVNAVRQISQLGDKEFAAQAMREALDGRLAPAGVDAGDAQTSLLPNSGLEVATPGADTTLANEALVQKSSVDTFLEVVDDLDLDYDFLSEDEKLALFDQVRVYHENKLEKGKIDDFEVEYTDAGILVRVNKDDNVTEELVPYTIYDQEGFSTDAVSSVPFSSPSFYILNRGDREKLVLNRERLQGFSGVITSAYYDALAAAAKPLRGRTEGLERALRIGDEWTNPETGLLEGREFSYSELVHQGVGGRRLSHEEAIAYRDVRRVIDHMHGVKSRQMAADYRARGYRMAEVGGNPTLVREYRNIEAARNGLNSKNLHGDGIYIDHINGLSARGDTIDLQKWYDKGFRLYRTKAPDYFHANGQNYQLVLRRPEGVTDIPMSGILNKRPGYMPKLHTNRNFFLRSARDVKVGGRMVEGGRTRTMFSFSSRTKGMEYFQALSRQPDYEMGTDGVTLYRLDEDGKRVETLRLEEARELGISDDDTIRDMGGLITGRRSDTKIAHDPSYGRESQAGEADRVNVLESLARYIGHLGSEAPLSVYREAMKARWKTQAMSVFGREAIQKESFASLLHRLKPTDKRTRALKKLGEQIESLSMFRTRGEETLDSAMRAMADALDRKGFEKAAGVLYQGNTKSVAGKVRGAAFNYLLGWFAPAQFIIQMSAATIPLSINPILASKGIAKATGFALIDQVMTGFKSFEYSKNYARTLDEVGKKFGIDMADHKLWLESGIKQNLLRAHADYDPASLSSPFDRSTTKKVLGANTMFYEAGELTRARVAFQTAVEYVRDLKGTDPTVADMDAIFERYEAYSLHMSKANKARWQHGLTSVPTQFMQVQSKTAEAILGRDFTVAERGRLLLGQSVLLGTAGVPLIGGLAQFVVGMVADPATTPPEHLRVLRDGAVGLIIHDYAGIDANIISRIQIGGEMFDNIVDVVFDGAPLQVEMLMGPAGHIWEWSGNFISDVTMVAGVALTQEDVSQEDWMLLTEYLGRSIADLPSSTRSMVAAHTLNQSRFYRNRAGKAVFEHADINTQTYIARALGFQLDTVRNFHELNPNDMSDARTAASTHADLYIRFLGRMADDNDQERASRIAAMAHNMIMSSYEGEPELREEIMNKVTQALRNPRNAYERRAREAIEALSSDMAKGVDQIYREARIRANPEMAEIMQNPREEIGNR